MGIAMSMNPPKEVMTLYGRVAAIIQNRITSGQYSPGDKLPTEDELVEYYGVSKITIRGALALLESDGYINRIRGKGTFVTDKVPSASLNVSSNLQRSIQALGRISIKEVELGIIKVKSSRTPKDNRDFFDLDNNDDILRIQRVISSGKILYYYDNYLPTTFAPYLNKTNIRRNKSLQKVLREKMGLNITKGEMYLQAVPADPDVSEKLECPSFEPLIHLQVLFWHDAQKPFEVLNIYLRSCFFKYKVDFDIDLMSPANE